MEIYLGSTGLDASHQEPFKNTTKCYKCGEKSKIMFVVMEFDEKEHVCELHKSTGKKGGLWAHDAVACASYLCPHCFEVTSILNQA